MPTLLCVPIAVRDIAPALADAREAKLRGGDLVEYRVDEFFSGDDAEGEQLVGLVADSPLPCIVTCRSGEEGGAYDGDDDARVSLYERLGTAEHPPAYIDVELATYTRSQNIRRKIDLAVEHPKQLRDVHTRLILSMHDFNGRPADLTRRLAKAYAEPAASVVKVAYRARSIRDNLELFEILRDAQKPTIALGMGEFGLMSRVLAPKFGGFLTFASLRPGEVTAPGQPTIDELLDLYRFRSIGRGTKVYGVIGWPVAHSMSPLVHNAGFEAVGHDGVYLPMPVAADAKDRKATRASLRATVQALMDDEALLFRGASVTMPFKEHIVSAQLTSLSHGGGFDPDSIVKSSGVANTIVMRESGPSEILNTDGPAAVGLLLTELDRSSRQHIGIVGLGGVARAVIIALVESDPASDNLDFSVFARRLTPSGGFKVPLSSLAELPDAHCDAFINCTPVGMAGGPDPDGLSIPIPDMTHIGPDTVFFDTVYNPIETPMLKAAKERGCRTIDGVQMFVRQAAAQFELWTGKPAPVELFDRLVREALGTRH